MVESLQSVVESRQCLAGHLEFWGVFGLPLDAESYHEYAKQRLLIFEDAPYTQIRYWPPPTDDHPVSELGLGVVMLERRSDYDVIIAVAERLGQVVVSTGFHLQRHDIGQLMARWYDTHFFYGSSSTDVLKSHCVDMRQKLAEESKYYAQHDTDS